MAEITQELLRNIFTYNEKTGLLVFKVSSRRGWDGKQAGSVDQSGYIQVNIGKKVIRAHRLVWMYLYGRWPCEIDHINGDRADNRLINLREVDRQVNCKNQKINSRNKTGVLGVTWDNNRNKYYASIRHGGKTISLGRHEDLLSAVVARKSAERKYGYHENHGRR